MGCLRALFVRIGVLLFLGAVAAALWIYREQVVAVYRRLRGLPSEAGVAWVAPAASPSRAEQELARLARSGGPAYIDLGADDVGALIEQALAREPRRVVDSIAVGLLDDELLVRGSLDLSGVPREALGPLRGALEQREPIVIGGPLAVDSTGRLVMRVTTLRVKDFPFPRSTIGALVRRLQIPGADGAVVPVPGLGRPGDVRVSERGVRVYRGEGT